ncbi:Transposase Tnp1/En/Spm-like [Arabidopsis thaliana x Arabidopsis arenosa]|uniref:Transposase Tnp1/En/Spm-like n=1 Tax=Arabidopsis thaliana x Arabidopsis arenosa TaxID=1240361 RepID=A0A8T2A8I2_9BRAS|nr:Transposase Tnp1/En/Spm-like [Arabidopsis thaliana x Arabidopsis arenosa]
MAKTRGGGEVGSRRSRRNQGLEVEDVTPPVAPATTLKVNKKVNKKRKSKKVGKRSSTRSKKVAAQDDEVEVVTPQDNVVEEPQDDLVDSVTPEVVEEEKDSEIEGEACLTGQEPHDDEEEAANMEEAANIEGTANMEEAANIEEAANMEEDAVGNGQDNAIPSNTDEGSQVSVSFIDFGDHVGPGSVTLSSFLGVLVSEHIPVTLADWRKLDAVTKETLWEEIQGRFDLQEEWKKAVIFKQMCNIWRGRKSRLVSKVRAAKTAAERLALKPSNTPSSQVWNSWVRSKTSTAFTEISNKYRKMRQNQIPHTTSRKGMLRLADDMKKKSSNPSKVTRSKVWIAGHTHADGRPVKPQFAETIKQIQSLDSEMDSTSAADNIREDAVSKILGKDKPGRVRGFGRGITATKLAFLQSRDAKMAEMKSEIDELNGLVRDLAGKKKSNGDTETCESSGGLKVEVSVQILDWIHEGEVVVGEGELCSAELMYKIGRIPIGPNAMAVLVKSVLSSKASLWRPTSDVLYLEEAVGCKIPWPMDKVLLYRDPVTSEDVSMDNEDDEVIAEGLVCSSNSKERVNNIPLGPSAVSIQIVKVFNDNAPLWRPTADISPIGDAINEKIAWPVQKIDVTAAATPDATLPKAVSPGSNSSTKSPKHKCFLLDCSNSGRKVAEGRVISTDREDTCHHVPLGPNASKVCVEVAKIGNAKVWRPSSEIVFISDAIEDNAPQHETEAFDLFKTAFSMGEGEPNQTNDDEALEANDDEAVEETEFRKKLREAETPLYSD